MYNDYIAISSQNQASELLWH